MLLMIEVVTFKILVVNAAIVELFSNMNENPEMPENNRKLFKLKIPIVNGYHY